MMKTAYFFIAFVFSFFSLSTYCQGLFFKDSGQNRKFFTFKKKVIKPEKYRAVTINISQLKKFLDSVPSEINLTNRNEAPIFSLITPDGKVAKFRIWERSVQEAGTPKSVGSVSTFTGQGIDDPYATISLDIGINGFHAQILTPNGDYYIDPYALKETKKYISYYRSDLKKKKEIRKPEIVEPPNPPVRSAPEKS